MTATIRQVAVTDPLWTGFATSHPAATAFHHPAWPRLLADCYGYNAGALVLVDGGEVIAGLPIVRVRRPLLGDRESSLPFTDYCPPLARGDVSLAALVTALGERQARDGAMPLQVRAPLPVRGRVALRSDAVLHTLRLSPDPDAVFRTFKRTQVQQRILKAEREGVVVRCGTSIADLRQFYALHLDTRRRLGVPVQPLRFFELLWRDLLEPKLGLVLLAYAGASPIAAAVFLAWNGTLIYKYSASDVRYLALRPNNLLLWTAIRWGCENGYHTFDMGRTELDNPGLRSFKNGWGTHEEPLVYSLIGVPASKHTPVARVSQLPKALIRRSPVWVGRAIGELLYRYAA